MDMVKQMSGKGSLIGVKGFSLRYKSYRNACFKFIKLNGPKSSAVLIEEVRNSDNKQYKSLPANAISLTSLLTRDPRFEKIGKVRTHCVTGSTSKIVMWGIKNE